MTPTPHDALFKWTFSHPPRAMELLRSAFAPELLAHLDVASAQLEPGSFVDEALRARHSDLLFRVRLHGRDAFVYLLLEHQSTPDPLMPFRMLRYEVGIWSRWLVDHEGATQLPVILPLVVSQTPNGWEARTLRQLYDVEPSVLADFARWLPDLELAVDDLSSVSEAELRARSGDALVALVLLSMKFARGTDELAALVLSWVDLAHAVLQAPHGAEAFGRVVRYVFEQTGRDRESLLRLVEASEADPQVKEAVVTWADMLREEGQQAGLVRGRQEGRQEGARLTLLRLLRRRFGDLPPEVVARVERAGDGEHERWTDRVLSAGALDEVFAD